MRNKLLYTICSMALGIILGIMIGISSQPDSDLFIRGTYVLTDNGVKNTLSWVSISDATKEYYFIDQMETIYGFKTTRGTYEELDDGVLVLQSGEFDGYLFIISDEQAKLVCLEDSPHSKVLLEKTSHLFMIEGESE